MLTTFLIMNRQAEATPWPEPATVAFQPGCGGYEPPCPTTAPPTTRPPHTRPPTTRPPSTTPPVTDCRPGDSSCLPETGDRTLLLYGIGVSLVVVGALLFTLALRRRAGEH